MAWRKFKALGTEIIITAALTAEQENILLEAKRAVLDFERRFSRFTAGNELAKLNNSLKREQEVSETMAELLKEAKRYYLETGGIFDPTVISSLEAVGYDRSFDEISSRVDQKKPEKINFEKLIKIFTSRPKMTDLKIDGKTINRPTGFRVDFGGIGKGYIVDQLSKNFFSAVKNYWISAGGDIIADGDQENDSGWNIGIQNPSQPEENIFFINTKGKKLGIATSGIIKRTGQADDFKWHHIIDPRTGLPVINEILSVTAISSSALRADIFAKTILILGKNKGLDFIEKENDSAAIIFTKDKKTIFSSRTHLYLNPYEKTK